VNYENAKPGMRIQEIGPTYLCSEEGTPERPARSGTVVEADSPMLRVEWDEGQDQRGALGGPFKGFVEAEWVQPVPPEAKCSACSANRIANDAAGKCPQCSAKECCT
jgi:hypothetical protein